MYVSTTNPINMFKVVECGENYLVKLSAGVNLLVKKYIELEYAPLAGMIKKHRKGEKLAKA